MSCVVRVRVRVCFCLGVFAFVCIPVSKERQEICVFRVSDEPVFSKCLRGDVQKGEREVRACCHYLRKALGSRSPKDSPARGKR
jgi:hypothetical protein